MENLARAVLPIAQQTAQRLSADVPTAEDVAQDATLKVITRLDAYNSNWKLATWVRVITRNTFIDRFRRNRKRTVGLPFDPICPLPRPDDRCEAKESAAAVTAAVERLPELYRGVVIMHHFHHMKYREIAAELRIPMGTVMNRMFRARRMMREGLEPIAA